MRSQPRPAADARAERLIRYLLLALCLTPLLALSGCAASSSLAGHDAYTHEHATPTATR
jgi:hypothetical protein